MAKAKSALLKQNVANDLVAGVTYRKIAQKYNISFGFINKIKKQSHLEIKSNAAGRPKKLSPADAREAKRLIVTGTANTAVEVKQILNKEHNLSVSTKTVRRSLKTSGLVARAKPKKPLLSESNRKKRLEFAKKYQNFTTEDWMRVTWSDETKINRIGSDGRQWTWVDKSVGPKERNICQTMKFGGGSLMAWGCFRGNQLGVLRRIRGKMCAKDYITILEDSYLPSLDIFGLEPGQNDIFMQDNDPKHTAKITKKWFEENGIKLLDWPPQSPDLNPIEHLWSILKRKIFSTKEPPKTVDDLWDRCIEAWERIDSETLNNLVKSMPKRIKAVKKARGGHTKY